MKVVQRQTRLLVLTGVHGNQDGKLGDFDEDFVTDCENQIRVLKRKMEKDIEKRVIQFKVEDVGQINNGGIRDLDEGKFVEAVKNFKPTVLLLAFCFSHQSELNDLLRAAGIYSTLILREELAQITESRHVRLDVGQENLIKRIAEEKPKNVFFWGYSGTGKTLMLAEALRMKISQFKRDDKKDVRVIVTTMNGNDPLMRDLSKKYLPDIDKASFMTIQQLTSELNIKYDEGHPRVLIDKILSSLSAENSQFMFHTILLVDEVAPMSEEEGRQGTSVADWSSLTSREGVDFLLSLSTFSKGSDMFKVKNGKPTDTEVLCQRLVTPHRNCKEISALFKYFVHHCDLSYLAPCTEADDEHERALHLPPGRLPVWVERSWEVTDEQVLDFIKDTYDIAEAKLSFTVLYHALDPSASAKAWCSDHDWRYLDEFEVTGSEDQCIVTIDPPHFLSEQISRARNLLVIVTTRGKHRWLQTHTATEVILDEVIQHGSPTHNCSGTQNCTKDKCKSSYIGRTLLQKVSFECY